MIKDSIMFLLYVDQNSVDMIYHQIKNCSDEYTISHSDQLSSSIRGNIGTNGLIAAEIDGEIIASHQSIRTDTISVDYVDKVKDILKTLFDSKTKHLSEVCQPNKPVCLVACNAVFQLHGAYDPERNKWMNASDIAENPYLFNILCFNFGFSENPNKSCNLFSKNSVQYIENNIYVDMLLSSKNLTKNIRHLTYEIKFGNYFEFCILGELHSKQSNTFHLKPYAIWRSNTEHI